jgi:hypothetical protein
MIRGDLLRVVEQPQRSVLGPAIHLTIAIAIGWVLCFWPARMLNGHAGVWWMSVAALCCLVPGWIVVFLSTLDIFPNHLAVMLVQMSVRLATVGGAAVVVKRLRPDFGPADFAGWLVGFYVLALFVEVYLLRAESSPVKGADGEGLGG